MILLNQFQVQVLLKSILIKINRKKNFETLKILGIKVYIKVLYLKILGF
jgi:hypothetical protein